VPKKIVSCTRNRTKCPTCGTKCIIKEVPYVDRELIPVRPSDVVLIKILWHYDAQIVPTSERIDDTIIAIRRAYGEVKDATE
jgi:hypothetical protein